MDMNYYGDVIWRWDAVDTVPHIRTSQNHGTPTAPPGGSEEDRWSVAGFFRRTMKKGGKNAVHFDVAVILV